MVKQFLCTTLKRFIVSHFTQHFFFILIGHEGSEWRDVPDGTNRRVRDIVNRINMPNTARSQPVRSTTVSSRTKHGKLSSSQPTPSPNTTVTYSDRGRRNTWPPSQPLVDSTHDSDSTPPYVRTVSSENESEDEKFDEVKPSTSAQDAEMEGLQNEMKRMKERMTVLQAKQAEKEAKLKKERQKLAISETQESSVLRRHRENSKYTIFNQCSIIYIICSKEV